ncbi:MAG: hypothetical protein V7603_5177 [Micromonosporaceae bacterium]
MSVITWLWRVQTTRWAQALIAGLGLLLTAVGELSLRAGEDTLGAVTNLAVGLVMCAYVACALRWRRTHRSLVDARATFRTTLRALAPHPTIHVNEDASLVFIHFTGHGPVYRWNILARVAEHEIDDVLRVLDLGEEPTAIVEEFEIRTGLAEVFASVNGTRLRGTDDGDVEEVDLGTPPGPWTAARGRYRGLAAGLLQASESDLREICAQLAATRPVTPTTDDD